MRPAHTHHRRLAFTLTELLVAIGIIAILIGILLPALGAITQRSKKAATQALMQQFADACSHFQQQLQYPPGLVPEDVLAFDTAQNGNIAQISGTENALLHLMGGAVRQDDVSADDWSNLYTPANGWVTRTFQRPQGGTLAVRININEMTTGRGPFIGGKQYERFFNAKPSEFYAVQGQAGESDFDPNEAGVQGLPDLIDSWGQPIIYIRAARGSGPIAGDVVGQTNNLPAQFGLYSMTPYIRSTFLGDLGRDQTQMSLFNMANGAEVPVPPPQGGVLNAFLAQVIRHAGMGEPSRPLATGVARGRFAIFSAGKDGIYFAVDDGAGSSSVQVQNIIGADFTNGGNFGPTVVDKYDDIRVFGGS